MNKPLHTIFLGMLCAALSFPLVLKAQTRGYIINSQYHMKGQVQYKKWYVTPQEISFKADDQNAFQAISPDDVVEIGFELRGKAEIYRSITVAIDRSPINTAQLKDDPAPHLLAPKKIFAQLLVDGKAQLYTYTDDLKTHYLLRTNIDHTVELINKQYLNQNNDLIMTNSGFKKQLLEELGDCSSTNLESVVPLTYTAASLSAFVVKYNKCVGDASPKVFTEEDTKIKLYALAGISYTDVKGFSTRPYSPYATSGVNMSSSAQPTFGIGATVIPSRSHFYFVAELLYRQLSASGNYLIDDPNNVSTSHFFDIQRKTVKVLAAGRYNVGGVDKRIFLLIGGTYGYNFNQKFNYTRNRLFLSSTQTTTETDNNVTRNEFGLLGGIGAEFKRMGIQFRYDVTNDFTAFTYYKGRTSTLSAALTYSL